MSCTHSVRSNGVVQHWADFAVFCEIMYQYFISVPVAHVGFTFKWTWYHKICSYDQRTYTK